MKTERTELLPAADHACAACPWRISNHGRRHPGEWYSKKNRKRLWNGLRTGEAPGMTCHPTDPENQPVGDRTETRECTGALLLLARELTAVNVTVEAGGKLTDYRRSRAPGTALTTNGLHELVARMMFGGTPFDCRPSIRDARFPEDDDIGLGL